MVTSERENRQIGDEEQDIDSAVRQFLEKLLDSPDADSRVVEANEIVAILEPLGLPANLRAAVLLYPLARDGEFDSHSLYTRFRKRLQPSMLSSRHSVSRSGGPANSM